MFAAWSSNPWSSTWNLLSDGVAIIIIAVLLVLGLLFGYALRGLVGRWRAETIEKKMRLREEECESEIKAKLKEADIAARAAVVKAKEEFDQIAKKRRAELQAVEDRLSQRENTLDRRAEQLDEKVAALEAKQTALTEAEQKVSADVVAAGAPRRCGHPLPPHPGGRTRTGRDDCPAPHRGCHPAMRGRAPERARDHGRPASEPGAEGAHRRPRRPQRARV